MKEAEDRPDDHSVDSKAASAADKVSDMTESDLKSRREFLSNAAGVGAAIAIGGVVWENTVAAEVVNDPAKAVLIQNPTPPETISVDLEVNGQTQKVNIDPRTSLLDALREYMGLTGSKKGCDHGQCGACTVLIDGRRVNSCLTLAFAAEGSEITTIEGLATHPDPKDASELHPMQAAFLEHDGYQCGYCTPGQICSAVAAIEEYKRGALSIVSFHTGKTEHPEMTNDEIKERMSGNICRCGAYPNIVAAVREVA